MSSKPPAPETLRPPVPPPTASSRIVNTFFIQCFLALDPDLSRLEANTKAAKLQVDGVALYDLSEDEILDQFGDDGKYIYNALKRTEYGFDNNYWPKLAIIGAILISAGVFEVFREILRNKEPRISISPIIYASIVSVLAILRSYCRSQAVIDAKWIPEGFKIRGGSDRWF